MTRKRFHSPTASSAVALAIAAAPLPAAATGEDGGSGLIRIGQAYSLSVGHPMISIYAGYYTSSASGSERVFTLTPSATFGLGSGFEAGGALPLEGATLALDGDPFDRRFDLSYRDVLGRIRWTGPLRTTRFRVGAEGVVSAPLGGRTRPGGDTSPSNAFDPGLTGLLSTNIGTFEFPVRVHLNAGWWWSRNDGAFYYRGLPGSVAVPGAQNAEGNDVGWAGVGAEIGLRRATLLFEVVTEQFPQARGQVHSAESLWLLTAGFRTALTPSVGLTGGLSLDLSSDDAGTAFDPDAVFPDAEIRVGITLGSVLSRDEYETRKRDEAAARKKPATAPAQTPARAAPHAPAAEPSFLAAPPAPATASAPQGPGNLGELEKRVRDLETEVRIQSLETRLRMLEMERRGDVPPATRALAPAAEIPPPAAPAPADTTLSLMNELGELQRGLQASRSPAAAGSKPPGEADAAPAETTIVAAPAPAAAVLPPGPVAATPPPAAAVSPTLTVVDNRPASPGAEWVAAARPLQEDPATPGATPEAGAADPDEGLVPLDQLLREYEERIAAPLPAPATEPMTPAASPAEEPSEPATAPEGTAPETDAGFPVPVGGRTKIPEIDVASTNPLATAPAREALDEWAAELVSHPDVAIAVTVYGGGTDLEQALALSERHAESVRHYLVVAGAAAAQVQALGMGLDPEGAARVEIERLR